MTRVNHAAAIGAALLTLLCAGCGDSEPVGDGSGSTLGSDDAKSIEFEDWKTQADELCASASWQLDTLAEETPAKDTTDEEIVKLLSDYVGVVDELRADLDALGTPTSSSPSMSESVQQRALSFIDAVGSVATATSDLATAPESSVETTEEAYFSAMNALGTAMEQVEVTCDLTSPVNRRMSAPTSECDIDRRTLETAASAFEASTGTRAQSTGDLVENGLVNKSPSGWEIIDGEVVAVDGSPCAE